MACYHPLQAWRSLTVNPSGKRGIVFKPENEMHEITSKIEVPCGQCLGCRLERSRQWAIRCMHEASLHADNCFITLTYNDDNLPEGSTLIKSDFQKFIKRLRKNHGVKIRYFACGEYGSEFARPHYHACIFGYKFPDTKPFKKLHGGHFLYTSESLAKLWTKGYSSIGAVNFETAAYVARYVTKKINGKLDEATAHYENYDPETGEWFNTRLKEYINMSLKPAVGKGWIEKFYDDVYPRDEIIVRGKKLKPPKYYDKIFDLIDPNEMVKLKRSRMVSALEHTKTPEQLAVSEQIKLQQFKRLKRTYESDS